VTRISYCVTPLSSVVKRFALANYLPSDASAGRSWRTERAGRLKKRENADNNYNKARFTHTEDDSGPELGFTWSPGFRRKSSTEGRDPPSCGGRRRSIPPKRYMLIDGPGSLFNRTGFRTMGRMSSIQSITKTRWSCGLMDHASGRRHRFTKEGGDLNVEPRWSVSDGKTTLRMSPRHLRSTSIVF